MALVSTLLVLLLMGALVFGFLAVIAADQQASGINRDQTQAYAAAHAGLEKLTADLGALFIGGNFSPSGAQIAALTTTPPVLPGFTFIAPGNLPGYTITPGALKVATVPNGPFQGLIGLITPYVINVTARSNISALGAAEARMRRELQTVAVPVFQFGIFSDNDLSFFAGPNFDFGGRVHTNQNAYVAQDGSATLTLREVFTAVGEVVRTHLANGVSITTSGHRGYVRLATTGGSNPTFRNLSCGSQGGNCGGGTQEGSVTVASVPPSTLQTVNGQPTMVLVSGNTRNEPTWTNISTGSYSNRLRSGVTGGRRLDLPLVADGAAAVDLVRRPSSVTPDTEVVLAQRFYSMASLRILLSDRASDITSLQTVTAAPPVDLARLALDAAYRADPNGQGTAVTWLTGVPLAVAGTYGTGTPGNLYRVPPGTPLQGGFLKIERQTREGVWSDVTVEMLNMGFTGRNLAGSATWNSAGTTCATNAADDPSPNAVIRLQRVRDNPLAGFGTCGQTAGVWSTDGTNYLPVSFYDPREGARRDDPVGQGTTPLLGGVMHYAELDVNNLRLWLATHPDTMDVTGFVVYFSDRRGNKNLGADLAEGTRVGTDGVLFTADDFGDDLETGEFGFEDIINPASVQSVSNGILDPGEDINGNGVLDLYGGSPRVYPVAATAYRMATVPAWVPATGATGVWAAGATATLTTAVPVGEARVNPQLFFRRSLKLVNGGYTTGNLRLPANDTQGLTVATENPIYIQGNFNAPNAAGTAMGTTPGTDHVSASVIADAVTFLSNNFNDIRSFMSPHSVSSNRNAVTTWYRVAVISGKGLNFARPTTNAANDHTDFGTDGGAHNFLRYIENWGGQTLNYRGSIISLYLNRQAVGVYKCCDVVYSPPTRGYNFDTDFLTPALLPPRTPMFRDINTLTFRQLLRPNQ